MDHRDGEHVQRTERARHGRTRNEASAVDAEDFELVQGRVGENLVDRRRKDVSVERVGTKFKVREVRHLDWSSELSERFVAKVEATREAHGDVTGLFEETQERIGRGGAVMTIVEDERDACEV